MKSFFKFLGKALLLTLLVATVIAVLIYLPRWQVGTLEQETPPSLDLLQAENEARRTLAQIFGGLALLVGLYLTWRRISAIEKQVVIAEEGQITERFTRAIDHLGSDQRNVRLGGIYALERIARDSERDRRTVVDVLMAYIRGSEQVDSVEAPEVTQVPQADVQAVVLVLSRLQTLGDEFKLDLRTIDLRNIDLTGARLEGAIFNDAILEGAQLSGAFLSNAQFRGADLRNADLSEAHLDGADLSRANLEGAHLAAADLRGAKLRRANLRYAGLREANLDGATLDEAILDGATLDDASLVGATLRRVSMKGTERFTGVDMRKAVLQYVKWTGSKVYRTKMQGARVLSSEIRLCSFWRADLEGVIFDGTTFERPAFNEANLVGADFSKTEGISTAQIEGAFTDPTTKFPDDMPDEPGPIRGIEF